MKVGEEMKKCSIDIKEFRDANEIEERIGIMGGTFDPIHLGHLFVADTALHSLGLDKIIFIPAGNPPHKDNSNITTGYHRLIMTAIAINDNPHFELSNIEIERKGPSYTVDTIKHLEQLQQNNKKVKWFFITGADAFMEIETWKNYKYLLDNINFVVATRIGNNSKIFHEKVDQIRKEHNTSIINMAMPLLEISSSDIRRRIKEKRSIKYLVTAGVESYIKKHRLYI